MTFHFENVFVGNLKWWTLLTQSESLMHLNLKYIILLPNIEYVKNNMSLHNPKLLYLCFPHCPVKAFEQSLHLCDLLIQTLLKQQKHLVKRETDAFILNYSLI